MDILIQHAQCGYGRMPAQRRSTSLSDADVAAAVAYVAARNRPALTTKKANGLTGACNPINNAIDCSSGELRNAVSLYMLLLLGGDQTRWPQRP